MVEYIRISIHLIASIKRRKIAAKIACMCKQAFRQLKHRTSA